MKKFWYDDIHSIVERAQLVKLPFEIIHFPSSGVTSAINRYAESAKNEVETTTKFIVIDLRAADFTKDRDDNKKEFLRVLLSHFEQYIDYKINYGTEINVYKVVQNIIQQFLEQKLSVVVVFYQSNQINCTDIPEYKDFLLFLDRLRDSTNGLVNFLLVSILPQFDNLHPAPFPIITKYYGYFEQGRIYRTIHEDILSAGGFKRHAPGDVLKLIELSGGLIAIAKALTRDLLIQDKKINTIYTLQFDRDFFETFENTKMVLDRIRQKLRPEYIESLLKVITNDVASIDSKIIDYLRMCTIIDESNHLRGEILTQYLLTYCVTNSNYTSSEAKVESFDGTENIINNASARSFYKINPTLKVDSLSGEIYSGNMPQNEYLTEQEMNVFTCLYKNANTEITREQIADILWRGNAKTQYSDWAIDKLISRLRDKLRDKKPHSIIKTVRNRGFIVQINSLEI